ncbi:MAG: 16S rRNA (cytidine(1402)-2'-O)-methyltransferase [Eubacteriales bacterium]
MGELFVVPTPIGNMSDVSPRIRETLGRVDFIACEDTRVAGRLLKILGLKKPLVSYHEHNKNKKGRLILSRLAGGESAALVTDAGTPAISDPGMVLVRMCHEGNIRVIPIAGPSAAAVAVSSSGIDCARFCFEGFLPEKRSELKARLDEYRRETRAMVFFSPPHDLPRVLEELFSALGDRQASLCKELTKLNEKITYSTLGSLLQTAKETENIKGEYVLVVAGGEKTISANDREGLTAAEHVNYYLDMGLSKMDAIKAAASDRGVKKSEVYGEINAKNNKR